MKTASEKLRQQIEEEEYRWAQHKIKRSFNGSYRAKCSCGWASDRYETWPEAEREGQTHKAEVR